MRDAERNSGMLFVNGHGTGLRVRVARSFLQRGRGLLGSRAGVDWDALLLCRCASIHTFGMSRDIDVCFVDDGGCVLSVQADLSPWRVAGCAAASDTWELAAGSIARFGIVSGANLSIGAAE